MHGDVTVTLSGFVATTPTLFRSPSGNDFTSFRIAQTRRYLDRERGEWVDGKTLWFTVKAWKHVARNVAISLHKGDPVVVTGRLSVDEWDGQDGPRTSLVVEVAALGPDLSLGEARFARTVHRRETPDGATAGAGRDGRPAQDPGTSTEGERASSDGSLASTSGERPDDPWALAAAGGAYAGEAGGEDGPEGEPGTAGGLTEEASVENELAPV